MTTITDRRTAIVQGGLLAADAAMASARPAGATDARGGPLRDALIGAWQLVSCVETDVATGEVFLPMGERPQGFILYTPDGYMSAQLSASDRRDFASGDMYRGVPEGPQCVSPNEFAAAFAAALRRPVRAELAPHEQWDALFRAQGLRNTAPRVRMLDGFNEGWIDFPCDDENRLKGTTSAAEVVATLVEN